MPSPAFAATEGKAPRGALPKADKGRGESGPSGCQPKVPRQGSRSSWSKWRHNHPGWLSMVCARALSGVPFRWGMYRCRLSVRASAVGWRLGWPMRADRWGCDASRTAVRPCRAMRAEASARMVYRPLHAWCIAFRTHGAWASAGSIWPRSMRLHEAEPPRDYVLLPAGCYP